MANTIDPATDRRKARTGRLRIRTMPPGLLLVGGGPASDGAVDLIALARAARRQAADHQAGEPPEQV